MHVGAPVAVGHERDRCFSRWPGSTSVFDNDGVLVDSEPIANRYLAELLGEYGLEVNWHDCVERYLGSTLTASASSSRPTSATHPGGLRGALPLHRLPGGPSRWR